MDATRPAGGLVSAASIWEIAIKFTVGRDKAIPFRGYEAIRHFNNAGSRILDITAEHAAATEKVVTPHADPFDRLPIAQAITEPLVLVTRDSKIATYSPTFITWQGLSACRPIASSSGFRTDCPRP
ncbi:MAG TPA: type II toxin-antitoxin system VapC family toxin [Pararhizobium sp.]|uniref:type II toxin-antitoxin system VapC family toxin n=1 Tax=Pararhizobium sp. TaxID=1977563 RepID=UPI002C6418D8|nr:type II toxin-antitoxin system VapC family toxin [Pararhizobium sp.]HTO33819.1 type II toxin-antitoxin system VapC family toxin [Pararhizobium sp.]